MKKHLETLKKLVWNIVLHLPALSSLSRARAPSSRILSFFFYCRFPFTHRFVQMDARRATFDIISTNFDSNDSIFSIPWTILHYIRRI